MSYQVPRKIRAALMGECARLSEIIDDAVVQSFRTADLECRGTPGEVDYVLSFFIEGLEVIENEFNRLLNARGVRVKISGIFTHQTPMVELQQPPPKRICELADLCIFASYGRPLARRGIGNALFLQAKREFEHKVVTIQRELYEVETAFTYTRPASLVAAPPVPPRRVLPAKGEPALAYWELEPWHWRTPWHGLTSTTGLLWANQVNRRAAQRHSFGAAMMDFFRGTAGYGFRKPAMSERNWSRIIFDLITVTALATVNRANLNVRGVPRGIGILARELLREFQGNANGPYVTRNSLGEILGTYSDELGVLGHKLEQSKLHDLQAGLESAEPDTEHRHAEEPPILGDQRVVDDGGGGAGNLVFVHFSEG